MNIEVICTGTELLKGTTVNSNAALLGRLLGEAGKIVRRIQTVGDRRNDLIEALGQAAREADWILVSGGLGSTGDDLTRDVCAEFFGLALIRDEERAKTLLRYFRSRHGAGPVPRALFRQADLIGGGEFLENANGSAPGILFAARYGGRELKVALLPGPPAEFESVLTAELLPRMLSDRRTEQLTRGFLVAGGGELEVERMLNEKLDPDGIELAYCAGPEGTRVFISAADQAVLDRAIRDGRSLFGSDALEVGRYHLGPEIVRLLSARGERLALAESCTGGLVAGAVTAVPGSSQAFAGAIVAYENAAKINLLNVNPEILETYGAVSRECAEAMARGAAEAFDTEIAGAVTGIAGPTGSTETKPVGLVHLAIRFHGQTHHRECRFRGNREAVREKTRATFFLMLYRLLI
ncbi:MAG: nicotinamide-nucleotide amidohydrolase family protein [Victivallaceae bacterium]